MTRVCMSGIQRWMCDPHEQECSSIWWIGMPCAIAWWRHQMETFSALLILCVGNSPVTGEFLAQRPVTWRALMFCLICARINGWVNNREAGDFRRHLAHYDVTDNLSKKSQLEHLIDPYGIHSQHITKIVSIWLINNINACATFVLKRRLQNAMLTT